MNIRLQLGAEPSRNMSASWNQWKKKFARSCAKRYLPKERPLHLNFSGSSNAGRDF